MVWSRWFEGLAKTWWVGSLSPPAWATATKSLSYKLPRPVRHLAHPVPCLFFQVYFFRKAFSTLIRINRLASPIGE